MYNATLNEVSENKDYDSLASEVMDYIDKPSELADKYFSLKQDYGFTNDEAISCLNELVNEKGKLVFRRYKQHDNKGELSVKEANELVNPGKLSENEIGYFRPSAAKIEGYINNSGVVSKQECYKDSVEFFAGLLLDRLEIIGKARSSLTPLPEKPGGYFTKSDLEALKNNIIRSNMDEIKGLWKKTIHIDAYSDILKLYPELNNDLSLARSVFDELCEDPSTELDDIVKRHTDYAEILEKYSILKGRLDLAKSVYGRIPAVGCSPNLMGEAVKKVIFEDKFLNLEEAINSYFETIKGKFKF